MEKYVQIENVNMVFNTKKGKFTALANINLNVAQGEFVALIGHSGCGKSTLLNLVAGLLDASSGLLLLGNKEIKGPGPERGVVFQNHSLLPWLTAFENVYLAVEKVFGDCESKAQLKTRTREVLELVGGRSSAAVRPHRDDDQWPVGDYRRSAGSRSAAPARAPATRAPAALSRPT